MLRLAALLFTGFALADLPAHAQRPDVPGTAGASQSEFLQVIENGRRQWRSAPNDIQREPMPAARAAALCALPATVTAWQGRVRRVARYLGSQTVSFSVTVGSSGVTLRTEGDLQNLGTKIEPGTPIFDAVVQLGEGARVTFSGEFIPDEKTCRRETSLTNHGLMTEPTFLFRFTSVEARR